MREGIAADLVSGINDRVDLEVPGLTAPEVDPGVDLLVDGEARGAAGCRRGAVLAGERVGEGEVGRRLGSALRGRLVSRGEEALVGVAPARHLVQRDSRLDAAHAGRHGGRRRGCRRRRAWLHGGGGWKVFASG